MYTLFERKKSDEDKKQEKLIDALYKKIGSIQMENDWFKKTASLPREERLKMINGKDHIFSRRKQCEL